MRNKIKLDNRIILVLVHSRIKIELGRSTMLDYRHEAQVLAEGNSNNRTQQPRAPQILTMTAASRYERPSVPTSAHRINAVKQFNACTLLGVGSKYRRGGGGVFYETKIKKICEAGRVNEFPQNQNKTVAKRNPTCW